MDGHAVKAPLTEEQITDCKSSYRLALPGEPLVSSFRQI